LKTEYADMGHESKSTNPAKVKRYSVLAVLITGSLSRHSVLSKR